MILGQTRRADWLNRCRRRVVSTLSDVSNFSGRCRIAEAIFVEIDYVNPVIHV